MRKVVIIILILNFSLLYGQTGVTPVDLANQFYGEGVSAFEQNDFIKADSLFGKSISLQPSSNAFFNRAVTKMILNDTCMACLNFYKAYSFFDDTNALEMYNAYCLYSHSTIYYDNKYRKIENPDDWKFYEEITNPKCESIIRGVIHKKNHKSSFNFRLFKSVDIFASYFIIDTVRYFEFNFSSTFENDNSTTIQAFKGRLTQYLNSKYDFSQIPHNKRYMTALLLINKEGEVSGTVIKTNPLTLLDQSTREVIEADLAATLKQMPKLKPEVFFKEPVNIAYTLLFGI